jgi:hypothetical protein
MNKGYVFLSYIIAENINIVSGFSPAKSISSRYGTSSWKSKSERRIEKINKILESIDLFL